MIDLAPPPANPTIAFPRPAIIMPSHRIVTPAEARGIKTSPPIGAPLLAGWTAMGHGARSASIAPPITFEYLNYAGATALQNYMFGDRPIGAADDTRHIIVAVGVCASSPAVSPSSVFVGGAPAELLGDGVTFAEYNIPSGTNPPGNSVWMVSVPTGTTASVAVNFPKTTVNCWIALYRVVGNPSLVCTNVLATAASGTPSGNMDVAEGGVVIATVCNAGSCTFTYGGEPSAKDLQSTISGRTFGSGSEQYAAAQEGMPVLVNNSTSNACTLVGVAVR